MIIITTVQDKIQSVAARWKAEFYFPEEKKWKLYQGRNSYEETYDRLKLLPEKATPIDVAKIMGNDHWVRLICDNCKKSVKKIMAVTVGPEEAGCNLLICIGCWDKMKQMFLNRK